MPDPTGFPVWLDGGVDGLVLVLDANGYRAAVAKGYTFSAANPPVTRPIVNNRVVAGAPVTVQPSVSRAQPAHPSPDRLR